MIRQDERLPFASAGCSLRASRRSEVADLEKNLPASCRSPSAGVTYPQFTLWIPELIVNIGAI